MLSPDSPSRGGTTTTFLRWTFCRAVFHRGYVLTSGLYFVLDAHLSAYQLLVLATAMSVTLVLSDIPLGVWSDSFSRKWPLVIGHGFLAAGMVMTGLVTVFPLLVVTQVLWGLGWAFSTGADVAWVTDESNRPSQIATVLTVRARWDLVGGAVGMVAFGLLGWAMGLGPAIVVSGSAMALVGVSVAINFTESNFVPPKMQKWKSSVSILQRGLRLSRRDDQVRLVLVATMTVNAAAMITWVFPKQLIDQGFPSDPVLWYTALGLLTLAVGILALRVVEARIEGVGVAKRAYALTCFVGSMGLVVLASAPNAVIGSAGILLVSGIAFNVTRTVSVIWVNRRTPSDIRATMHSFLSQAESVGEILGGVALAGLAALSGTLSTILASAALIGIAGVLVGTTRTDQRPSPAIEGPD